MLEVGFKSENLGEIIQCQIELEELAARLQAEQGDLVTAEQCEAAKESLDAFVALVDQAMEKAARNSNTGGVPGSAELQKQIESLQKSLEKQAAGADPKNLEKFLQDLQAELDVLSH